MDTETYAVLKKYTDESVEGAGSIRGKNCTIQSVTNITGGHRITFAYYMDDGTKKTETVDVMNGPQGIQGPKGDTGNTGATGPAGANGANGQNGQSATIRVGNVTSGQTPSINNSGTNLNAVFDFVLPKGDKGDKGEKGNDGADGKSFDIKAQYPNEAALRAAHPTGEAGDAYFVGTDENPDLYVWLTDTADWFNNGKIAGVKGDKGDTGDEGFSPVASVSKSGGKTTITIRDKTGQTVAEVLDGTDGQNGADGADGAPGKSAYQIAVDEGFVGTVTEWLASLKGDPGVHGTDGANGTDGISPVARVTETNGVYKIHIEDATGTTEETFDISDKVDKPASHTTNHLIAFDQHGNLEDTGVDKAVFPEGASSSNKLATANDVSNKATKPTGGTSGNLVQHDANGALSDAGKKIGDLQTKNLATVLNIGGTDKTTVEAALSALNDLVKPTVTAVPINSTDASGYCGYFRIGKIVVVLINGISCKVTNAVVVSAGNLPVPASTNLSNKNYHTVVKEGAVAIPGSQYLCWIEPTGALHIEGSANSPVMYGELIYIASTY